ncbi:MAG: polymerase sigma factor, sigma-70 family [Schlesneria sp.]|nr:polymerase sigma factor, sigma-70 family [Schlesneria sp.]
MSFEPSCPVSRAEWSPRSELIPGRQESGSGPAGSDLATSESENLRQRFDAAVKPLLAHLLAHAKNILRTEDLAWDAVQEALLSLWGQLVTGAPLLDYAGPWLCRAVEFRSLQIARTLTRRARHESEVHSSTSIGFAPDNVADAMERAELCEALELALSNVPAEYRQIFEMRELHDMDYAAIAKQLQIPLGTVRSRLSRSRRALRERLRNGICHETFFNSTPTFSDDSDGG